MVHRIFQKSRRRECKLVLAPARALGGSAPSVPNVGIPDDDDNPCFQHVRTKQPPIRRCSVQPARDCILFIEPPERCGRGRRGILRIRTVVSVKRDDVRGFNFDPSTGRQCLGSADVMLQTAWNSCPHLHGLDRAASEPTLSLDSDIVLS